MATKKAELSPATQEKYNRPPVAVGVLQRFPLALAAVAEVSVFGTQKHGVDLADSSFLTLEGADTMFLNAEARHLLAESVDGPINPDDGGLLHKAQKAWNALADLEVYLNNHGDW